MVSSWILRSVVLVLIQSIGCNERLPKQQQSIVSNTSKTIGANVVTPCDQGLIWDMVKQRCVPICKGEDCKTVIECPEGLEYVKDLGVCGIPLGDGIYEIRHGQGVGELASEMNRADASERLLTIKITNSETDSVFLNANYQRKAQFEISGEESTGKITIPENYFCPNWCPDKGMPQELDCGRPPDMVIALAPGQSTITEWSGYKIVDVTRYSATGSKSCVNKTRLGNGTYQIEIAAYKAYQVGNAVGKEDGGLRFGKSKGNPVFISSSFQLKEKSNLEIVIKR